ncbi:HpcH/HpaI aldolase/citrate lyase family protein [Paraburkholderia sp. DGU8]|uniref:HpcH/HpaI aldolase family protein n=1 Tax=Paraburkholderia sp. DGU8 TaxID=3161997 RepID=UPI0034669421
MSETFKQRLIDRKTVISVNVGGRNPDIIPALAKFGAHCAFIDCERTGISIDVAIDLIRASKVAGIASIVRSMSKDPALLVQYLDRQADGLVIPHVNTAKEAEDLVELVHYACGPTAATRTLIVQIETKEAIEALDEMMLVKGIDAFLIGPNDLAYSLMSQRGAETPEVNAAVDYAAGRLRDSGRPFGLPARFNDLSRFNERGANFLYYPVEWLIERALSELSAAIL